MAVGARATRREAMKSAAIAFASIVAGLLLGLGLHALLEITPNSDNRGATAIVVFTSIALLLSGAAYGRWFSRFGASAAAMGVYFLLVAAAVNATDNLPEWSFAIVLVTLTPWLLGVLSGWYSRRIHLTP